MKTIGVIGGMSWESTVPYYRDMNELVKRRLGGLHSARVVLYSVDFAEVARIQAAGAWNEAGMLMAHAAHSLQAAGADVVLLATNTMHEVAYAIEAAITVPFIHIADPTGEAIRTAGLTTVGLLGTRFTMERDFYRARLAERHGIAVVTPAEADRAEVHRVIYEELALGVISERSRNAFAAIIERLADDGAEGVILGCTEIPLLVRQEGSALPLFDTGALHVRAAVDFALAEE
ncbi:MAG TPA: aspartate racemase [Coriobacteriia bacterium]|nr:MAG: Aspartate racemase [Actinobacteria bacterium 66_15]HAL30854.1 aspartate racemase [Coriobacteriia bacterium]